MDVRPLDFDDVLGLTSSLQGATTLYNTYWVRFPHDGADFDGPSPTRARCSMRRARRGWSGSSTCRSRIRASSSPYGYFRGKAEVERALAEVGVPYAVLRPAILFGGDGVLLNNIAWLLRHLPVFAVGGSGEYRIRAVHIDDLAVLAVEAGADRANTVTDAVGPERPTFMELVQLIRERRRQPERDRPRPRRAGAASGLGPGARAARRAAHGRRVSGHGRRAGRHERSRHGLHRLERVGHRERRLIGSELRQRDRPTLPAPRRR